MPPGSCDDAKRSDQIRALVMELMSRMAAGETIEAEDLQRDFAPWMPELWERWKLARLVARAEVQHDQANAQAASTFAVPKAPSANAPPTQDRVPIACPYCRQSTWVDAITSVPLICERCGESFQVIDTSGESSRLRPGGFIGRFELIEQLGRGAFGTVWKALDPDLDRIVAIKVPRLVDLTPAEAELFYREARAAAQVRHPHTVTIHEVGHDGSYLYLVCDYLNGGSLADWQRQRRLPVRRVVELCEIVARALAAVHQAGIVHRDLKPANILLNDAGAPFLADFGLARRSVGELPLTIDGQLLGTPAYMSPEQARGNSHSADARSDIYSLGVILFELLTGDLPFRGAPMDIIARVLHQEPPRLRHLDRSIPVDLETICLKCLEKDPDRRFASALELADDLSRYLRGEPIRSRQISWSRRSWRWCRRRPLAATLGAVLLALAIAGPLLATREKRLRNEANLAKTDAIQQKNQAVKARRETELARDKAILSDHRARRLHYLANMQLAQRAVDERDFSLAKQLLQQHLPPRTPEPQPAPDFRRFEWFYLWKVCHENWIDGMRPSTAAKHVRVNREGNRTAIFDGSRVVWMDLTSKRELASWDPVCSVNDLALGATGDQVFVAGTDGTLRWWDMRDGAEGMVSAHAGEAFLVRPLPDGTSVLTCGADGWVKRWELGKADHVDQWQLPLSGISRSLAIAPDGSFFVVIIRSDLDVSRDHSFGSLSQLARYDISSSQHRWIQPLGLARDSAVAISHHGKTIASAAGGHSPRLWSAETGEAIGSMPDLPEESHRLAFSPDGQWLASFRKDGGNVRFWNVADKKIAPIALPHAGINDMDWHASGKLISAGSDGWLHLWELGKHPAIAWLTPSVFPLLVSSTPSASGDRLMTVSQWHRVQLWDLNQRKVQHAFASLHEGPVLSGDGRQLVSYRSSTVLRESEGDTKASLIYQHPLSTQKIVAIALSPDQQQLAIGISSRDETSSSARNQKDEVILWDVAGAKETRRWTMPSQSLQRLVFTNDGTLLLSTDFSQLLGWDIRTGKKRFQHRIAELGFCTAIQGSADHRRLAIASSSGMIQVIDLSTGRPTQSFSCHDHHISDLAFSADNESLLVAAGIRAMAAIERKGAVYTWDLTTGQPSSRFAQPFGCPVGVTLSRDMKRLTIAYFDGRIAQLEAASDTEVAAQRSR